MTVKVNLSKDSPIDRKAKTSYVKIDGIYIEIPLVIGRTADVFPPLPRDLFIAVLSCKDFIVPFQLLKGKRLENRETPAGR